MEFKQPYFKIEDLKLDDLKTDVNIKPRGPIEPDRLKSIYTQAFIYDLLYKFAKEYLPHVDDTNSIKKNIAPNEKTTDTTVDSIKDKVIQYLLNLNEKKEEKYENEIVVSIDSIWNTNDLNVLRKHFTSIKEENFLLKSKLIVNQEENIKLKEELTQLKSENKSIKGEKLSLEQFNERLYIRVQDLEKYYLNIVKESEIKDKERKELLEQISKLNTSNSDLLTQKSKLEYELNKSEYKLSGIKSELDLNYNNLIDKLKIRYKKEIKLVKERLAELLDKYKQKKIELERAQKALDHLRIHFMTNSSQRHKIEDNLIQT